MEPRLTGIDRQEALVYLGYKGGGLGGDMDALLDSCAREILEAARPRIVWRRFQLLPDGTLAGTDFRPEGRDTARLLRDCREVILLAVTLGAEIDALLRRSQIRDMARAMVLDACASAAVENLCDNLCADLAAEAAPLYLTDRFSPGYGDLPLAQQADFSRLLELPRRIGVHLSPGGLMLPQKSVTALLGLSPVPQPRRSGGCAKCGHFESCAIRREGQSCGNE